MGISASCPAVIAEEAEIHLGNNPLAALGGHGELSQGDSSEWELVYTSDIPDIPDTGISDISYISDRSSDEDED